MAEDEVFQKPQVHEGTDFEQWVFEFRLDMAKVQMSGDVKTYEMMLNTLLNNLSPYMNDVHKAKWAAARTMGGDADANKMRIEEKEILCSTILDDIGAQFTRKKKARISEGVKLLWEMYPPFEGFQKPSENEQPTQPSLPPT